MSYYDNEHFWTPQEVCGQLAGLDEKKSFWTLPLLNEIKQFFSRFNTK